MLNKKASVLAVASAFAMMLGARDAGAAAFALYEQGVSGLGNAYAGAAAVAEDATTAWWNPAGMSWLPAGMHLTGAAALIDPSTKFSNRASTPAVVPPAPPRPLGDEGGDAGSSVVLPSLFFATNIGPKWNVGMVINTPFWLKTEYDSTWIGRFQGIKAGASRPRSRPSISTRRSPIASTMPSAWPAG
jgi:long-chain fatty acid transport protein